MLPRVARMVRMQVVLAHDAQASVGGTTGGEGSTGLYPLGGGRRGEVRRRITGRRRRVHRVQVVIVVGKWYTPLVPDIPEWWRVVMVEVGPQERSRR